MKFGFSSDIGEITPNIFSKLDHEARARAFLTLYNACVQPELRVPLSYAKFGGIQRIFHARIERLLQTILIKKYEINNICLVSNAIIRAFKTGDFSKLKFIASSPKYAVAKMIKMLYASGKFELCFDAEDMFCQFVYDKISLKNRDKNVYLEGGAIFVEKDGKKLLGVLPSFKQVDPGDAGNISAEISKAVNALNSKNYERVFIVFPRNENFKRHVEVRHTQCARGCIKLVPYTIISKIF